MLNLKIKRVLAWALALICLLSFAACGKDTGDTNDTALIVGGREISATEYNHFFNIQKDYMDNGDESYWAGNTEGLEKLRADALNSLSQFEAIRLLAKEHGVTVTDEQAAQNAAEVDTFVKEYGEEELNKWLAEQHLTLDMYESIVDAITLDVNLYEALADSDVLGVDVENIKQTIRNDYVCAMHILYADEAAAQGILEAAKAASDEEFYELAQSAEDPGMIGNTEGYVFTYNQMVEPFETATYALEVGQTSDLVKSDYGYHIIRKLEVTDEYIDEHFAELAQNEVVNAYYDYVDEYAAKLASEAEFTDIYYTFTVDTSVAANEDTSAAE